MFTQHVTFLKNKSDKNKKMNEENLPVSLKIGLSFQKWIGGINKENEEKTKDDVATTFISVFCGDDRVENMKFVATEICLAAERTPESIPQLSNLVKYLTTSKKCQDSLSGFRQLFVDVCLSTQSAFPFEMRVRLLRSCFENGIYTIDEICDFIVNFPIDCSSRVFILLALFGPEVDAHSPSLFNSVLSKFEVWLVSAQKLSADIHFGSEKYREMMDCIRGKESDWSIGKEIIKYYYPIDSIEYIIKNDDVSKLKEKIDQLPTELRMKRSYLNPFSELITMLQFSALLGSIKCFDFLLSREQNKDELYVSSFAVEGGSMEIVKRCDEMKLDFTGSLIPAVLYRRNEILEWLLKNKTFEDNEVKSSLSICMTTKNIEAILILNKFYPKK